MAREAVNGRRLRSSTQGGGRTRSDGLTGWPADGGAELGRCRGGALTVLPHGFRRLRCAHHAAVVGRLGAAWISLLTNAVGHVWGRRPTHGPQRAASRRDPPMRREEERAGERGEHEH
jgi:hypothetical protein